MDLIDVSILLVMAVLVAVLFPNLLHDLAARIRALRAGAVPVDDPVAAGYDLLAPRRVLTARGFEAVRQSPGHRNFGIPRSLGTDLGSALTGRHPGLDPAAHILGDH